MQLAYADHPVRSAAGSRIIAVFAKATVFELDSADVHTARMRSAGKELLSLALIDARNRTLRWFALHEEHKDAKELPEQPGYGPPLWLLGHLAWFQEYWIARNAQRSRGASCAAAPNLPSMFTHADSIYDPSQHSWGERWKLSLPDVQATRQYLADTMEITLELLDGVAETDEELHFFRLALFNEDLHAETWAELAQSLQVAVPSAKGLLRDSSMQAPRPPLLFPATRVTQGSAGGGFAFDNEKRAHEVAVPEFEIDSQAVSWEQYAEFVSDGGYDNAEHWSAVGWEWLQREGRRVPHHVDQLRNGVLQRRFGHLVRVSPAQPALHTSWYEAEAWCRWAGRRLPTEVEWEAAALAGASRGYRWGDVWEWTATTFRPYPGFVAEPPWSRSEPSFGTHKVLRGASFATAARVRYPKYRRFDLPTRDDIFCGFRSCEI